MIIIDSKEIRKMQVINFLMAKYSLTELWNEGIF